MRVSRAILPGPAEGIKTSRLLLRPMTIEDVAEFHILRTQPEVMINTSVGVVDADHTVTRAWMNRFLHPNDSTTFTLAIEELSNPGVILGSVGSHTAEPPTLGYMLRKEYWKFGYATEAVQGWLNAYWKLPRREIEMQDTMPESAELHLQGDSVREVIVAIIESKNAGSIRVMEKCGFKPTGVEDQVEDFRGPAIVLHYYLERPHD